jgi:FixJ family two-component response regulator
VSKPWVIAVVEDDDSFRMALVESLHSLGYEAREFASAEEFILGDAACDCVITDVRMPGMSGLELSRILASRVPSLPTIMITAGAAADLNLKGADSAPFCVLKKPFATDALIDCLHRALEP